MGSACKTLVGKPDRKRVHLEDLGKDERIMLKRILNTAGVCTVDSYGSGKESYGSIKSDDFLTSYATITSGQALPYGDC
jgi:hypothetical protein